MKTVDPLWRPLTGASRKKKKREEWQWSMAANVMVSKDREVNLILIWILINSVCVSITAVVTSMQAIIRGMHVNIPYGHFRIVMTYCVLIISRFLMRIYR